MQKILLSALLMCLFSLTASAQSKVTWNGVAMDQNWDTDGNWDSGVAPINGDTVVFNTSSLVGGTATGIPAQIQISSAAQVTFQTNITVGDGTGSPSTLFLGAGTQLIIDETFTLTLNPELTKNGVEFPGGGANINLIVRANASLVVNAGKFAINMGSPTGLLRNLGTIDVVNPDKVGVRCTGGTIDNQGTLNITGGNSGVFLNAALDNTTGGTINIMSSAITGLFVDTDGVVNNSSMISITDGTGATADGIISKGSITNASTGTISIAEVLDDNIDVRDGVFQNDGTLNVTMRAGGGNNNVGVLVGFTGTTASFNNTSNNSLNVIGATDGTAIFVNPTGTLTNTGTITTTGGKADRRVFVDGVLINDNAGTMDMTDGRILINAATGDLLNNGLMVNDWVNPSGNNAGMSNNSGTALNNGFYKWEKGSNGSNFAVGSGATVAEPGINLKSNTSRFIVGGGGNMVDIAEASYTYIYQSQTIGVSDATGALTIDCATLDNDSVWVSVAEFAIPVNIRLNDVCAIALPIELMSLRAIAGEKSVMVKWETATEINNDYMAVEKSTDGERFSEIGRLAAQNQYGGTYELEDATPASGMNFYRLRQVDLEGSTTYSDVVTARYTGLTTGEALRIYPTIVGQGEQLNVQALGGSVQALTVYDANGKAVSKNEASTTSEGISLSIGELQPGIYYLTALMDGGVLRSGKFIVR